MEKNSIVTLIQERVEEQDIVKNIPFASLFIFLSQLLGENPWKIMIPFSFVITLILHFIYLNRFDEIILKLFRDL